MTMPYFTHDQIEQVRSVDLLTYLLTYEPTELVHLNGNTYCTREHDSLKISNGKWYWWSRGFGSRSALDYLIKVKGMTFIEAMKILADDGNMIQCDDARRKQEQPKADCKKLLLPEKSENNFEVIRYLTGRGIDGEIVKDCIEAGLIYESLPYHNCIFVGFDETGRAAYACYRATNGERVMGDAAGSDKHYAFRINCAGSALHVFESAIDLLSYATIMKMRTGEWKQEPMLSLGGVYEPNKDPSKRRIPIALQNMLQNHPEVTSIALHLDNDAVGKASAWAIEGLLRDKYNISYEPSPSGKDYNDYLQCLIRQKRPRQLGRE